MTKVFIEENGLYCIDCSQAKWATDQMHHEYHHAGVHLSDVDFLIEDMDSLFMVEYKNANIKGAANPDTYDPNQEKNYKKLVKKFYDSLHYLNLLHKVKPVQYICVVEYPASDSVTRRRLRNRLKKDLPFQLQENIGKGRKLIEAVDVVSLAEWNENEIYGKYPISLVKTESKS